MKSLRASITGRDHYAEKSEGSIGRRTSTVSDYDKTVFIIRSREISISIAPQSVAQLEGPYGHTKARTITENCDHLLYLGGQSLETAQFIGNKVDRPASGILNMPLGEA